MMALLVTCIVLTAVVSLDLSKNRNSRRS